MDDGTTEVPPAVEKTQRRFLHAHARSNSTGKIGGSCIRQPVASRFMSASMGSCHDLCKHGMRNVAETNKDTESVSRKKSRDLGDRGSVNVENVGHAEGGGSRRAAVRPKVGNEKGSLPRIGSDPSKGHVNRSTRMVSLTWASSNAGKVRSDVSNVIEGKGPNKNKLRISETNLADVHEPASLPGPSSMEKPKLTVSSPERKSIGRSRSGGNLIRAPSFLSSSSQESLSFKGGKSRTIVRKRLVLDNKDNLGKKLSFRRLTSLERHPDDYSPRRLRFRRPMSREIQASSSENVWRNIRRVEQLGGTGEVKSRKQERVILRHRSMEKRQEGRRLFNNVIEETASKLVKARKSKVKALVGAFETVISLQDKKVRATSVTS